MKTIGDKFTIQIQNILGNNNKILDDYTTGDINAIMNGADFRQFWQNKIGNKSINITIKANEWFDKVNGNSYHNTILMVDGVMHQSGMQSGYDNQYLQTADHMLKALNLIPDHLSAYRWMDKDKIKDLGLNVTDKGKTVGLKRDLLIK